MLGDFIPKKERGHEARLPTHTRLLKAEGKNHEGKTSMKFRKEILEEGYSSEEGKSPDRHTHTHTHTEGRKASSLSFLSLAHLGATRLRDTC